MRAQFNITCAIAQRESRRPRASRLAERQTRAQAAPVRGRDSTADQTAKADKWPMGLHLRRRQGARAAPSMRNLLGGKGANLAEMANLGLPVPPGFTITTEVCTYFYANQQSYPKELESAGRGGARRMSARITGRQLRRSRNDPLLVSVRSGARASMPGMMDTVLNLGLNDETVEALAQDSPATGASPMTATAASSTMYSDVVLGVEPSPLRGHPRRPQGPHGLHARHRSHRRRLGRRWSSATRSASTRGDGRAVPAGPARAAVGRDRRGVRLLDEPARHHLPPPARHSGKLGHRGQRAGHGVRQHGRHLGHRRRLHPQSVDRREARSTASS